MTVVAYARRPILTTDDGRELLRLAIKNVREKRNFQLLANVLLPDHWHLVMQLPTGDSDYSIRMKRIKEEFTTAWLARGLPEAQVTPAQAANGGKKKVQKSEEALADQKLKQCVSNMLNSRVRGVHMGPTFRFRYFVLFICL